MRIEFYVLSSSDTPARLRAACQLAVKAWRATLPVFIRASDAAQAQQLDEMLWQFKPERFIPHDLHHQTPLSPIVLGTNETPQHRQGVLINLASDLSPYIDCFARIIEVVNQEPALLNACRDNFRTYRQRGFDPKRVEL